MRELNRCLHFVRRIEEIDERICEIRAAILSPKNQRITGMPRGGNTDNAIERYIIQVEKLEGEKENLSQQLTGQWLDLGYTVFKELTAEEKHLLTLRFLKGLPWKKCAKQMNEKYGNWNINKVFRVYGKINEKYGK